MKFFIIFTLSKVCFTDCNVIITIAYQGCILQTGTPNQNHLSGMYFTDRDTIALSGVYFADWNTKSKSLARHVFYIPGHRLQIGTLEHCNKLTSVTMEYSFGLVNSHKTLSMVHLFLYKL